MIMFSAGNHRKSTPVKVTLAAAFVAIFASLISALTAGASSGDNRQLTAETSSSDRQLAVAISPPKSWKLSFSSNFSGKKLNTSVWETCYPWSLNGCTNFGNKKEKEWYQASQVHVKSGVLYLTAKRTPTAGRNSKGAPKMYACRSGMVTTFRKFHFTYGYIQITARIPFGGGLWSALWLAAANEKWPPEVDILEHLDSATVSMTVLHPTKGRQQGARFNAPTISKGWHSFTLYWTKMRMTWYYDGHQVLTTTKGIPKQAMYLIANVAVTNANRGNCSGTLLIKSVKVWQP